MLNIEKYKNAILNFDENNINCCVNHLNNKGICFKNCKVCKQKAIEWLLSEYKAPILDDVEKEYLSAVIKPFRKMRAYIVKAQNFDDGKQCIRKRKDPRKGKNYIKIEFCDGDRMFFPNLSNDAMYKGMELGRKYTLEE